MRNTTSYSEAGDYVKCPQLWFNKYVRKVRRIGGLPYQLAYGIAGHEWLAEYYRSLRSTCGTNMPSKAEQWKAISDANAVFVKLQEEGRIEPWIIADLIDILSRYVFQPQPYGFEILEVERKYGDVMSTEEYNVDDPENKYIVMIIDLLIKPFNGRYAGKIGVWDHKFVENFPNDIAVMLNSQLPKQVHTLRNNGTYAEFAALNHLRYRKMNRNKNYVFSRSYVPLNDNRIEAMMQEHVKISRQLVYLKSIKPEVAQKKIIKILQPHICKDCEMSSLCNDELNGVPINRTRDAFYRQKEDGYGG